MKTELSGVKELVFALTDTVNHQQVTIDAQGETLASQGETLHRFKYLAGRLLQPICSVAMHETILYGLMRKLKRKFPALLGNRTFDEAFKISKDDSEIESLPYLHSLADFPYRELQLFETSPKCLHLRTYCCR